MGNQQPLKVIIGLVFDDQDRIVIAQRRASSTYPGYWEFPGGKQDADETPRQALSRELWEEIGIWVRQAQPFLQTVSQQGEQIIELNAWQVLQYEHQPYGREGQHVQPVNLQQLHQFTFPEGNEPILQKIRQLYTPIKQ